MMAIVQVMNIQLMPLLLKMELLKLIQMVIKLIQLRMIVVTT